MTGTREAECSPQRHGEHREDREFRGEYDLPRMLCDLGVSVVKKLQEGRPSADPHYAKQTQFSAGQSLFNSCSERWLGEKAWALRL